MESSNDNIASILKENDELKRKIKKLEEELNSLKDKHSNDDKDVSYSSIPIISPLKERKLNKDEISRYGRQLIMKDIGPKGQKNLIKSSVLLVGAGGLASPAALYLAGAGVGRIGIVDYDVVEMSNLQRQIIHDEHSVGKTKVGSAYDSIKRFNSLVECIPYHVMFNRITAMEIIKPYDIVLDCSDNVVTRYLINDACFFAGKTLISGSALRMEGQVVIYNDKQGGPCYRCLFSKPPPREAQGNCSSDGVLGVVPGIIGCIQALEAIKILAGSGKPLYGKMLMFDALSLTFRTFKIRGKRPDCELCGENPTIHELVDYEMFCNSKADDKQVDIDILDESDHITVEEYSEIRKQNKSHILIDVREKVQYEICSLDDSISIPLCEFEQKIDYIKSLIKDMETPVYTLCRRGNDSQLAHQILIKNGLNNVKNIKGGLVEWSSKVDNDFPLY